MSGSQTVAWLKSVPPVWLPSWLASLQKVWTFPRAKVKGRLKVAVNPNQWPTRFSLILFITAKTEVLHFRVSTTDYSPYLRKDPDLSQLFLSVCWVNSTICCDLPSFCMKPWVFMRHSGLIHSFFLEFVMSCSLNTDYMEWLFTVQLPTWFRLYRYCFPLVSQSSRSVNLTPRLGLMLCCLITLHDSVLLRAVF